METKNEFSTDIAFHPGETLAERLQELKMGPKEFSVRTGKPEKTIIAILKGNSSITPEMAILFESVLKIPASYWIKKQYSFDEYEARTKRKLALQQAFTWANQFPISDMIKNGWIKTHSNEADKVNELFHFFEVSSPKAWEDYFFNQQLKVAFKISLANYKHPHSISAWIRQGEIQANRITCVDYNEKTFKGSLSAIKQVMVQQPINFFKQIQEICLASGVKLVYTPSVCLAPLSGATRWIGSNPVIQVSDRHTHNEEFWFTFFHEVGHILLHGKKEIFLEDLSNSLIEIDREDEANNFSVKWTFSSEDEAELMKDLPITEEKIVNFSQKIGTHPALIVGRLRYKNVIDEKMGEQFFCKVDLFDQ